MSNENKEALFERLKSSNNLPTLPHILLRVIDICNREETNFKELSSIIETDPALAARILQLINSPYFKLPNRVINLDKALILLGMDTVKNIALCASIHQVFKTKEESPHFNLKRFWGHSLLCGLTAKALAQKMQYPNPDEAFLTGLLHDIGKMVLLVNLPKEYGKMLSSAQGSKDKLLSEEAKLGALHSEVGAWLITEWNLPSLMADAIAYHHEPLYRAADAFGLVKIIYSANVLSQGEETERRPEVTEELFGLGAEETGSLLSAAQKELTSTARHLDIAVELEQKPADSQEDKNKQNQLKQEIRNITVLLGTLQSMLKATSEASLIGIFYQALRILHGLDVFIFFKYDYERDLLIGKETLKAQQGADLAKLLVPYSEGNSLLVMALRKDSILDSFESKSNGGLCLMDEQIKRYLKKAGFACFPLLTKKSKVGVLVIGLDNREAVITMEKEKQINLLINQAALALHTDNLRKIQRRQLQSERIEASSEMARRIAHEANNPLSIIRNYLSVLKKKLKKENKVTEELGIIKEELDRVARLLDELSEFSTRRQPEPEYTDINTVISDLIALSRETLLAHIFVQLRLDKELPQIMIHKDRLKQIVLNLIKNAAEAMAEKGVLKIITRLLPSFPIEEVPEIAIDTGKGAGFAQIVISDNGPGIPETLRLNLFEPYITTKGKEHQGIGLSVVYNTVRALKGTITLQSRKGEGTRFTILFPLPPES